MKGIMAFDADGYPLEESLEAIRTYDLLKQPVEGLLQLVKDSWKYPDAFRRKGRNLELHTYGWSGNEAVIGALQQNILFWHLSWEVSKVGGHFWFTIHDYPGDRVQADKH